MRGEDFLFFAAGSLYLVAALMFGAHLLGRAEGTKLEFYAPRLVAAGAALHGCYIVIASFVSHVCPVEGIHFPMSVFAWLMVITYLVIRRKYRMDAVGAFVTPLALTSLLASRFVGLGAAAEPSSRIKGIMLPIHVSMNMLGVALCSLAFAAATLYLIQEHQLKAKKLEGLFQRLPPLDALDKAEHRFLLLGFPLLTIGILTGTIWAHRVEMGHTEDLLRAGFGYVTWLVFGLVLVLRAAAGWRGRRAAYGTIFGFLLSLIVLVFYLVRAGEVAPAAATNGGVTDSNAKAGNERTHIVARAP